MMHHRIGKIWVEEWETGRRVQGSGESRDWEGGPRRRPKWKKAALLHPARAPSLLEVLKTFKFSTEKSPTFSLPNFKVH